MKKAFTWIRNDKVAARMACPIHWTICCQKALDQSLESWWVVLFSEEHSLGHTYMSSYIPDKLQPHFRRICVKLCLEAEFVKLSTVAMTSSVGSQVRRWCILKVFWLFAR